MYVPVNIKLFLLSQELVFRNLKLWLKFLALYHSKYTILKALNIFIKICGDKSNSCNWKENLRNIVCNHSIVSENILAATWFGFVLKTGVTLDQDIDDNMGEDDTDNVDDEEHGPKINLLKVCCWRHHVHDGWCKSG